MNNKKNHLFVLSQFYFLLISMAYGSSDTNLIQISSENEIANVQMLKAILVSSCDNKTSTSKCAPRIEVRKWLNSNENRETFLLIDEVFDLKEQIQLPLLHPYLIQVSAAETIASFPLQLEQNVDVSCSQNDVRRREVYQKGMSMLISRHEKVYHNFKFPIIFFFINRFSSHRTAAREL